jgi:hypothetical protein
VDRVPILALKRLRVEGLWHKGMTERRDTALSGEVGQNSEPRLSADVIPPGTDAPGAKLSRRGGMNRRRMRENLLALVLFTGLSLLLLGPWILGRMSTWFLSVQPQDGSIFVWMFRWWPYALAHRADPLYTTAAWAPGGINLAWVTSVPALAVAMTPVTLAFGPFVAFNIVQLAAPALASWTGYLLCRKIVGSFGPALLGGLCFGFSPFLIGEVGQGHPNLALAFMLPAAAYLLLRLAEGSIRPRWFVPVLGVLLAVQLYLSTEVFATMTLIGVLAGLAGLAVGGRTAWQCVRRVIGPVASAYGVALALGSPLLYVAFTRPVPYKPVLFAGLPHGAQSAADFLAYVIPGRFTFLGGQFGHRWGVDGNPWYFGVPLILLLILFVITGWRQRHTWMIAASLALTLTLSVGGSLQLFGAHVLPWRLLAAVPVLGRAQPGRLVSYAFLFLGIAVAMWLARPTWRWLRWALAVLALLTILPNVTSNVWARRVYMPRLLTTGTYRGYLTPGETVWVVDDFHSRQMIWQAETGFTFRLAGGFFGVTPPGLHPPAAEARLGLGVVKGVTAASIRAFLRSHRAGAVLVADEPPHVARAVARATGVAGIQRGGLVRFRLGPRPRPAAAR